MAEDLVGGALVGAAVSELLKAVLEAKQRVSNFKDILTSIESTLVSIKLRLDEIIQLNNKLNTRQEEMKELVSLIENGTVLVLECCKISMFRFDKKDRYYKQLLKLQTNLTKYFTLILPMDQFRDIKEILALTKEMHFKLLGDTNSVDQNYKEADEKESVESHQDDSEENKMEKSDPDLEDERDSSSSTMGSAKESPMTPSLNNSANGGLSPLDSSDQGGSNNLNAGSNALGTGDTGGETCSVDASRTKTSSSRDEAPVSISDARDMESESTEEYEPGVYITIRKRADGTGEIQRVRFSRRRFGEKQAELWWSENRERVFADTKSILAPLQDLVSCSSPSLQMKTNKTC